jgi:hypothetical protein
MLGDHAILNAEHIEPKRLVMLTVTAGPRLADINHDHVVVADDVQKLALVVGWQFLREPLAKRVHEAFQPGGNLISGIALNVIRAQKARSRVDVAANQHGRVEITDNVFVVFGQGLISQRRLRYPEYEDKNETAKGSKMLIHKVVG